jgi:hypothetical protein
LVSRKVKRCQGGVFLLSFYVESFVFSV